jgi:Trypsin-like peptidase domain
MRGFPIYFSLGLTAVLNILEQIALCTVRVKATLGDGSVATGTGFIHKFDQRGNGLFCPAIVTNKHVIRGATSVSVPINITTHRDGDVMTGKFLEVAVPVSELLILEHPDSDIDLCAILTGPLVQRLDQAGKHPAFLATDSSIVADQSFYESLLPFEPVCMIGYPNGIWDHVNNSPIARQGSLATHPKLNYQGRSEFVIDMACFPGSSGSPVFIANFGSYIPSSGGLALGNRVKLLGVLYAGPQYVAPGVVEPRPIPVSTTGVSLTQIPNNLGYVIKAAELTPIERLIQKLAKT